MSIRNRLLLGSLSVVVILVAAALLGLRLLEGEIRARIGDSSLQIVRSTLGQVERDLYGRVDLVRQVVLTSDDVRELLGRSNRAFAEMGAAEVAAFLDREDAAWRTWSRRRSGEAPAVLVTAGAEPVSELLRRQAAFLRGDLGYDVFSEIFLTNRYGANVAQTNVTSDYRQDDEDWWQAARRDGVWLSDVAFDDSAEVLSLDLAVALPGDGGRLLGVVKAVLNAEEVHRILDPFAAAASRFGGGLELVDRRGTLIYPQYVPAAEGSPPVPPPVGDRAWTMTEDADGSRVLRGWARSSRHSRYPELGWTLTLSYPADEVFAPVIRLRAQLLAMGAVVLALAAAVALWLSAAIARPIEASVAAADRLARGDLATGMAAASAGSVSRSVAGGEAGRLQAAMTDMVAKIRHTLSGLVAASHGVAEVAERLSDSGQRISMGVESQARASGESAATVEEMAASIEDVAAGSAAVSADVEETSSSIEEMAASIETVARNTEQLTAAVHETLRTLRHLAGSIDRIAGAAETAGGASETAVEEARSGGDGVRRTAVDMAELAETIGELVAVNERLTASSQRIDRVTEVIEDIAGKTNLLALNAAIQASHAGEHGRGFAIVAEQVKHLAERSSESAKEISALVAQVQADTENASRISRVGAERVGRGVEVATRAAEALGQVEATVRSVSESMLEISRVTGEQASSADELVTTFERMSHLTEEVDRATREHALGSERIRQAMHRLSEVSDRVAAAVDGHRSDGARVGEAIAAIAEISGHNSQIAAEIAAATTELQREAAALRSLAGFFSFEDDTGRG